MNTEPFRFLITPQELERHPRARAALAAQMRASDLPPSSFLPCATLQGELCRDIHGDNAYGAYVVPDARLSGPAALIVTVEGKLIREQNAGLLQHDGILTEIANAKDLIPGPEAEELDEAVSLVSTCTECFWHWMMDSLPKVMLAEETGFSGTYVVPTGSMAPTYMESLSLLGIGPERCVSYSERGCKVKRLWIPTYFSGFNAPFNPAFIRKYRERLLSSCKRTVDSPKKMYVARKPSARNRRVVNHDDVEKILHSYGFTTIFFEDFTLPEQISFASHARVIVAPHGSGLTHSLFMEGGSLLIELFPFNRGASCDCYERLATVMSHRYASLESEHDRGNDVEVNLDAIHTALKNTRA